MMNPGNRHDWLFTPNGDKRGYIQPQRLQELWFHTGSICNLSCPFCFERAHPGDQRIEPISDADAAPFIEEALSLGVEQFSFTGGEPFVNRDLVAILERALRDRPCLVLSNGTAPLQNRMQEIVRLQPANHPLSFRISLDHPDPDKHDAGRGEGTFALALDALSRLHRHGFPVSIARQATPGENPVAVEAAYRPLLQEAGLPADTRIVSFPDFLPPGAVADVPQITEHCMTTYKDEDTRAAFMCSYSKMLVKRNGQVGVYACTLVDDDQDYDLAPTLTAALDVRVMLKHHRCYSCFACGASCSEPSPADEAARAAAAK